MKITIEAEDKDLEDKIIEAYIRHNLKGLRIIKVEIEKEKNK